MARENNGDARTQERKGVERAESAIIHSPSNASPFLKELDSIVGPSPTSAARVMDKLDRDGFTGRAEALEATKIMGETKNIFQRAVGSGLTPDEIKGYAARTDITVGERALAQRLHKDFNNISQDGKTITNGDISNLLGRDQRHEDLRNLYAKDSRTGKSLYDSVKDGHGGISGESLDQQLRNPSLSNRDRASLGALNDIRSGSGNISAEDMGRANQWAHLTQQERQSGTKSSGPLSAEAQAGQAALSDLTAKPYGGASLLDRVSDGHGGLSMSKIRDLSNDPRSNNLTQRNVETLEYLKAHAPNLTLGRGHPSPDYNPADLQKLASDSGQNWDRLSTRPERTRLDDFRRDNQKDFAHLFEKRDGTSLYERIKGDDGGISSSRLQQELDKRPSGDDLHTLSYIKGLARDGWLGKKDIPVSELVEKAHGHYLSDSQLRRGGLDPTPRVEPTEPRPGVSSRGELPESVRSALKVRPGEGYYHNAERLIAEAHKGQNYESSPAERNSVTKALIAAQWKP